MSSPQICKAVRHTFPDRPEMHVAHEIICQALYVQGGVELRRELATALRTGQNRPKPRRRPDARQPRFATPMVLMSDRPAEAEDRAVPGRGKAN